MFLGNKLAEPVHPINIPISQHFEDRLDQNCCQKPGQTQHITALLPLNIAEIGLGSDYADENIILVGFDSG